MTKEVGVFIPQRRCIACPECGKGEHIVEHLLGRGATTAGPWYCDGCGYGFTLDIAADGATVTTADAPDRNVATRCLVRLRPGVRSLVFEVEHMAIGRSVGVDEGTRYWFEESTCACNFLRRIVETWADGERDPHGIFEVLEERADPVEPAGPPYGDKPRAFTDEDVERLAEEAGRG